MPVRLNWTTNVAAKLNQIVGDVDKSRYLGVNNGNVVPYPLYRGIPIQYHIQGVQRYGKYLILSAGYKGSRGPNSHLILIQMGSRQNQSDPWGDPHYMPSNSLYNYKYPKPNDQVLAIYKLDATLWHGGGIQMADQTVAVPISSSESGNRSQIRFYDFSNVFASGDPSQFRQHPVYQNIPRNQGANAVAFSFLPNNQRTPFVLVWDDKHLDFYHWETPGTWTRKGRLSRKNLDGFFEWYNMRQQNINLLLDTNEKIFYLVGFRNISPTGIGRNIAQIFSFSYNLDPSQPINSNSPDPINNPQGFKYMGKKTIRSCGGQCNLNAGAGLHLNPNGRIFYYATSRYFEDGNRLFNFNEYT